MFVNIYVMAAHTADFLTMHALVQKKRTRSFTRYSLTFKNVYEAETYSHTQILQWARHNDALINPIVCAAAAEGGHLHVLQWLRANGFQWDWWTCADAAKNGHFEVLKWARANGCEWNNTTCNSAALSGNSAHPRAHKASVHACTSNLFN